MNRWKSKEEAFEALRHDELLKQAVRLINMKYPECKVYTDKWEPDITPSVFMSGMSREQCTDLGKMLLSDYSYETASEDLEYPIFIDRLVEVRSADLINITNLG